MKKVNILLLVLCLFVLIGCKKEEEPTKTYEADVPTEVCVGEDIIFEVKKLTDKDVKVENYTPDEIVLSNDGAFYKIHGKSEGFGTITIDGESFDITVKPRVNPTEVVINIDKNQKFITGVTYKFTYEVKPAHTSQEVTYNCGSAKIDIDFEKGEIVFNEAGLFDVIFSAKRDKNVTNIIKFDVDFNPDIEMYQMLYIGNSFTHYTYCIPTYIKGLMDASGVPFAFTFDAPSGFYLDAHEDDYENYINNNRYTHIIFQEQSNGPRSDYDRFESAVLKFAGMETHESTKFVMYETWAYDKEYAKGYGGQEVMTSELKEAYEKVADQIDASIARVGEAFWIYHQAEEKFDIPGLYLPNDASHPNAYGAYLSACVHYVTYRNKPVTGNGFIPSEIDEEIAQFIWAIADTFIQE